MTPIRILFILFLTHPQTSKPKNKTARITKVTKIWRKMDRVFSVGEISEQFWSNPPDASSKMNRSESEWAFQRFLQEAQQPTSSGDSKNDSVVEIKSAHISSNNNNNNNNTDNQNDNVKAGGGGGNVSKAATSALSFDGTQNLEDYQAVLKSKLNLACAAVALSRVSFFFFLCVRTCWFCLAGRKVDRKWESLGLVDFLGCGFVFGTSEGKSDAKV